MSAHSTVILTGGSAGIGLAIAERSLAEGRRVINLSRRPCPAAGVEHIGLGGDYDGVDELPEGLSDASCYPALITALAERGWSADDLTKLGWRNIHRVLGEAEVVAAELRDRCGPSLARIEDLDPSTAALLSSSKGSGQAS